MGAGARRLLAPRGTVRSYVLDHRCGVDGTYLQRRGTVKSQEIASSEPSEKHQRQGQSRSSRPVGIIGRAGQVLRVCMSLHRPRTPIGDTWRG